MNISHHIIITDENRHKQEPEALTTEQRIRITCEYKADYNSANLKLEITVEQHNQSSSSSPISASNQDAIAQWRNKLEYLRGQEAITSNPAIKYELNEQIQESRQKIKELGG